MNRNSKRVIAALLFVVLLSMAIAPGISLANNIANSTQDPNPNPPDAGMNVYLPLIRQLKAVASPSMVGVETNMAGDPRVGDSAKNANVQWARTSAFNWRDIEPVRTNPPTYKWEMVKNANIYALNNRGIKIIATVKFQPSWAQKYPGWQCGPIAEEALDEFVQFMQEAVRKYSVAPYRVDIWEIGNEPDIYWQWISQDSIYGCWGEENDTYYGGGYFATMLERVYPAIKAIDPSAKVMIGGLLLDCDPTNPPPGKTCKSSHFFEGILRNNGKMNGANYFDIVSFHGYPGYNGTLTVDENVEAWKVRGGVVLGKVSFLREVMANYGVNKPIFHSEGALLCPESYAGCNPPGTNFYEAQSDYVVWLYVRNWAAGLMGTIWFPLEGPGWRYSSLLDSNQNPKPAYYALKFLTEELAGVNFVQQISNYSELRTYEFAGTGKKIWVMWAPDDIPHTVTLPASTTRVVDKYGNQLYPVGGQLTIKSPVYVEMLP